MTAAYSRHIIQKDEVHWMQQYTYTPICLDHSQKQIWFKQTEIVQPWSIHSHQHPPHLEMNLPGSVNLGARLYAI